MATDICVRRLTKELRALQKDPIKEPKITCSPLENNILELHYVIEGSHGTPYENGIYHGKLLFPQDYPLRPPSVIMLTPSGRFQPSRRLCLSMSDFHPETWNPMWSVSTILTGLYSFMIETAPTHGSIETSLRQRRLLARTSLDFNVRDPVFCKLFPEYVEIHGKLRASRESTGVASTPVSSEMASGLIRNDRVEIPGLLATLAGVVAILSIVLAVRFF